MNQRPVVSDDVRLSVIDEGDGPAVLLVHGFPELAYSWRHQVPAVSAAGFRALAPDMRGYGASDRPDRVEDYDITHLTGDLLAILDAVGAERAVVVGHDWGSMVAWQFALLHPDRCAGVVGMSVPFVTRPAASPMTIMRQIFGESFFYILYFQEPGVADADLGQDASLTLRRLLCAPHPEPGTFPDPANFANDGRGFVARIPVADAVPDWLTEADLAVYGETFARTGFTGALNWYRNFDRNWELTEGLADAHVTRPSLFVGGDRDPVLTMSPPGAVHEWLDDHRGDVLVAGAGHWVQQESPGPVNEAVVGFASTMRDEGRY